MTTPQKGSSRRILTNGAWLLAPKTVGAVLSLVYLALIARSLGPERFGSFALMFSFAQAVAGIAAFQTWQMLIRYGTQPLLDKDHKAICRLLILCLGLDFAAVLLGAILAGTGIVLLAQKFGWSSNAQQLIFILTLLLLASSRSTPSGLLRLFDDFKFAALIDSLVPVLRFAGVMLVYLRGPDVLHYLIIWVVSEMIPTIVIWGFIFRKSKLPYKVIKIREIPSYLRSFPDFGRYALWSSVSSSLRFMNQQIIVVVVGFFANIEAAGFFRLGHQLGQVLARIADGISLAFFMEFARVDVAKGEDAARPLLMRTILLTAMSSAVIFILLLLLGRPALELAFGEAFLPAFPFVLLLGAAAAIQVGVLALEPVLMARGFAGRVMFANLIGAMGMIFLLILLLPRFAALGAAIAVLGSTLISAIAMAIAFRRTQIAG